MIIEGFIALYIFMLAAFTGYEIISKVPVILHTPLMSGACGPVMERLDVGDARKGKPRGPRPVG